MRKLTVHPVRFAPRGIANVLRLNPGLRDELNGKIGFNRLSAALRPVALSLTPPNGTSGSASPMWLIVIIPASTFEATCDAVFPSA